MMPRMARFVFAQAANSHASGKEFVSCCHANDAHDLGVQGHGTAIGSGSAAADDPLVP